MQSWAQCRAALQILRCLSSSTSATLLAPRRNFCRLVTNLENRQLLRSAPDHCHWRIFQRSNTQHRVVLLPELPPDTPENNPLLKNCKAGLPDLASVTEANCYYGLGIALLKFESAVCALENQIEAGQKDWEQLLTDLEGARIELEFVWSCVNLLNIVTDKLEMDRFTQLSRRAERAFLSRYNSRTIHSFLTSEAVAPVTGEDKVVLDRFLVEYHNQGFDLPEKKYLELNANWMKRLSEAQRDYRFKVTSATQRFRHLIRDPSIVREFPTDLMRAMAADSSQPARGPWSVTLHPYIYRKFMQYCPERKLRWNAYTASVSRGSRETDVYLNCSGQVKDIRQHRLDQAVTLGYQNYAEMSMMTKMAGSVEAVNNMLLTMLAGARTSQEIELASLQEYAESRGFEDSIREFDVEFFRRKQIRTLYGVDEEAMREFFPLPHVLKQIFGLIGEHYGLNFELLNTTAPSNGGQVEYGQAWCEEVSLYRVTDQAGELKGHVYLDPYIRDNKAYQGGDRGWYVPLRPHSARAGSADAVCHPLGCVAMTLAAPGYGKPSLLSLNEVRELLRQFGKVMMHMGSTRKWAETSGRTGIEWDALNMVPELMTHWLTVPHVLARLSSHWSTGDSLQPAQVENLILAGQHMAGYDTSHELYKAAYDMAFYTEDYESEQYQDLADRMARQYLVLDREREDAFPLYFEDMMTGSWGAGYYSHLWSRMLAADIFSAYLEAGWDQPEAVARVSRKIRETFLAAGSSVPTAQSFRDFRGRDPNPEALMLSLGLKDSRAPKKRGQSARS